MRISDWSSDVCSSDLADAVALPALEFNRVSAFVIGAPDDNELAGIVGARVGVDEVVQAFLGHQTADREDVIARRQVQPCQRVAARCGKLGNAIGDDPDTFRSGGAGGAQPLGTRGRNRGGSRSEERSVGEDSGRTCRFRWSRSHYKKK